MIPRKIRSGARKSNCDVEAFDHWIAVDWSTTTMAIARLTKARTEPMVIETQANQDELKAYLAKLPGHKVLTFEETTTAHWLYLELHEFVDRIIICDPVRNRLLSEGPKTDKIDARKLCLLLRSGLLKEVFHTLEQDHNLRKFISAYEDVVKMGVRLLNQRAALYRAYGCSAGSALTEPTAKVIDEHLASGINWYEETKASYEALFRQLLRTDHRIRRQTDLPGIACIGAVKIVARVIDARRFADKRHYLSYCGLVKHQRVSGQRLYGYRRPRFDRTLKAVYKTAALNALMRPNPMREYYDHLRSKGIPEHHARHAVARRIATISYGMLKTATMYEPYRWREHRQVKTNTSSS